MKTIGQVKIGDEIVFKQAVGKYDPIYYAGASGDFNFIHIDAEFAKMVGFKKNILHGLCTYAFCARAHTEWAGDPYALRRLKVRFSSPVYPDDTVTVKIKVTDIVDDIVHTEFAAVTQEGAEVVMMAAAEVQLPIG